MNWDAMSSIALHYVKRERFFVTDIAIVRVRKNKF